MRAYRSAAPTSTGTALPGSQRQIFVDPTESVTVFFVVPRIDGHSTSLTPITGRAAVRENDHFEQHVHGRPLSRLRATGPSHVDGWNALDRGEILGLW